MYVAKYQECQFIEIDWCDVNGSIKKICDIAGIDPSRFDYSDDELLFNDMLVEWDDGFMITDKVIIINKYIFEELYGKN